MSYTKFTPGDWEDVSRSMKMISGAREWPVCRGLETKNRS